VLGAGRLVGDGCPLALDVVVGVRGQEAVDDGGSAPI
jgi:hypothetical protein